MKRSVTKATRIVVALLLVAVMLCAGGVSTFATTVTLTNGVPIESVSKMLGHRSLKTTQIYAKIVNDKLAEDMTNLSTRLQHLAM